MGSYTQQMLDVHHKLAAMPVDKRLRFLLSLLAPPPTELVHFTERGSGWPFKGMAQVKY